ncbi:unnamed protein product [Rotaria sp. Silwood2]|nr:unnamed protein product [Rotaria sp. Silwood2]CAF2864582.1 unnamed protein product [Rotaria sp. Silwood2]CAF3281381.1 unnamed protein product [Rotaria sp. Silwood2]CAF4034373.1 unnamed protein product [Rotaria sp. Silwood2]CAF4086569.1 unnamed protein product [Rotaria sp. Silwood2]
MAEILLGRRRVHQRKTSADNADSVRVVGAGLPRTGTSSLKSALEILGFGPCHHMSELCNKPEQSVAFARALDGYETNFFELMKGYGSTVDFPTAIFYKEIHKVYPEAKIILTVRDSGEKWYESFVNTIEPVCNDITYYIAVYPIRILRLQCIVARKFIQKWKIEYGKIGPHLHDTYNACVIKENKQNELLVFDVKEGWPPLCKFLNVPIPTDIPFPQLNDAEYIKRGIRIARIIGWITWGCIVAIVAIAGYFII